MAPLDRQTDRACISCFSRLAFDWSSQWLASHYAVSIPQSPSQVSVDLIITLKQDQPAAMLVFTIQHAVHVAVD